MAIHIDMHWPEIHERNGLPKLRHSGRQLRGECPFCGSHTGFSENDDFNTFHCFACGISGDKIGFIQRLIRTDFKGALRWYGIEPGRPPAPDPNRMKAQRIRENLIGWKREKGREGRDQLYAKNTIRKRAMELLKSNSDSEIGWSLLRIALLDYAKVEYLADRIGLADERNDKELFEVYQEFKDIV